MKIQFSVGVSIKPAYVFAKDASEFSQYFRIGFGERIFPKALEGLINFVQEHKEDWRE